MFDSKSIRSKSIISLHFYAVRRATRCRDMKRDMDPSSDSTMQFIYPLIHHRDNRFFLPFTFRDMSHRRWTTAYARARVFHLPRG